MSPLSLASSDALHLWGRLAALFCTARLAGVAAGRLGQPAVVGALVGGILLGPSGLGAVWPAAGSFFVPRGGEAQGFGAVTGFCLMMVLVVLGAETNLPLLRGMVGAVTAVSAGSILLPLAAGAVISSLFAGSLLGEHAPVGALLLGGALGVSSLPVIARLVRELGVARRDFGQLAIATATVNDIYGFLLLIGVGVAVNSSGVGSVLLPVGGLIAVLLVIATAGRWGVDAALRRVRSDGPNPAGEMGVTVGFALVASAAMQAFGMEGALGAFFAGIVISHSRFHQGAALGRLSSFADSVFAPLYFAAAGLQVDLHAVGSPEHAAALGALLAGAVLSKAAGAAAGARAVRLQRREAVALAVLLNGRGTMQVILGTAGYRMGLLPGTAFTLLMVVSVLSSVLVAPAMRRLVGEWPGSEHEQRRLAREKRLNGSVLVRGQRLLVPATIGGTPGTALALLDRAWPQESELTFLHAGSGRRPAGGRPPGPDRLAARQVRTIRRDSGSPVLAVLAEANLGYGVLGIGVGAAADFLPMDGRVTHLLNASPLPVVIVIGQVPPVPLRRVVVGVTGTTASRSAEELAMGLCERDRAELVLAHLSPLDPSHGVRWPGRTGPRGLAGGVRAVPEEGGREALRSGVRVRGIERETTEPVGRALADLTTECDADLLVVGARLRRVEGRPFLGHTVRGLLHHRTVKTMVIVALPDAFPAAHELRDQPYADRRHT